MPTYAQKTQLGFAARVIKAWMGISSRYPRAVLLLLASLMILAFSFIRGLGIDSDSRRMLDPNLPDQHKMAELTNAFPQIRETIAIVITSDSPDAANQATADLSARLALHHDGFERVFAPVSDPFFAVHGFLYRDPSTVEAMFAHLSQASDLIAQLRQTPTAASFFAVLNSATRLSQQAGTPAGALDALYAETTAVLRGLDQNPRRPFAWSTLADAQTDGVATRVITVLPVFDKSYLNPVKPALETIRKEIAALDPDLAALVQVGVTGEAVLRTEEMQSVTARLGLSLTLSLIMVAALLWFGLRSARCGVVAFASLVITLILTAGFAGAAIGTLNLISIAFVVLMVGLGIDFAIHILAHLLEISARGAPLEDAIEHTAIHTGTALCLSAVTTSLSFLAFATTKFDGMAQLGVIGGVGVGIALFVSTSLIPALASLRPGLLRMHKKTPALSVTRAPSLGRWPVWGLVLLGIVAIVPALDVRFDADPMSLRNPQAPAVRAFADLAARPGFSPYHASLLRKPGPETDRTVAALEALPQVLRVTRAADLVPKDQDAKLTLLDLAAPSIEHALHGEPTGIFETNANEDAIDAFIAQLDEMKGASNASELAAALKTYQAARSPARDAMLETEIFRFFPQMLERLEDMLSADTVGFEDLPAALRTRYVAESGEQRIDIMPAAHMRNPNAMEEFAQAVVQVAPDATGGGVHLFYAGKTVSGAVLQASLLSGLAAAALALLVTRSVWTTLAILLPLALAGLFTAAASTLLDLPFNYANVIVLPLMIGIGIDSGIHLALRIADTGDDFMATSTPRAVILSAATTVAAFGTLGLSAHPGTASMGIMLTISMLASLLCIFVLTPVLVRRHRLR